MIKFLHKLKHISTILIKNKILITFLKIDLNYLGNMNNLPRMVEFKGFQRFCVILEEGKYVH